ncbi:MAG: stage V sporulation protein D (sporulation-specific penicillin-binding protein) [Candidatus Paceibacteria bacterium]|jgi:stage V sporulation protein D (sporulation-specific penicillin-binding protein)
MNYSLKRGRIFIILAAIILAVLVIITKLYFVQIINGDVFSDKADRQYYKPSTTSFDRGSVIFETKDGDRIDAATLSIGYILAINPSILTDAYGAYDKLNEIIEIDKETFIGRASKTEDPYEEIATQLTVDQKDRIEELEIDGVSLYKNKWRFYPGKSLASHVLGFMSYRGDEYRGQYGLERYYNDILERNKGSVYANFFVELFSNIGDSIKGRNSEGSLVTTIEPTVQTFIEKEVSNVQEDWSSKRTGVIVMDPKTGEIRAMAVAPTFNLNDFSEVEDVSDFSNPLVESVYEMGSIVKPLTMAIGLDTDSITPDTTYDDKGSVTVNTETFYNYDKEARGVVDMQTVLNKSLNTGVAFVVGRVGNEKFSDYMKRLVGEETGVDLPNEAAPLIDNLDSPRDIEHATASFGQGIAMSPIAITRALATLGNGGVLVNPHVVKEIDYDMGFSKEIVQNDHERIFSEETSETISRMLTAAVDDALVDGEVSLTHHSVAAKTGTAQIANLDGGGYYESRFLHSFFGYFPSYDPKFIVFLYTIEPQGALYASQTLTDPFMNITKFLINYYEIPPDR